MKKELNHKKNSPKIKVTYRIIGGKKIPLYDLGYSVNPLKMLKLVRSGK